MPPTSLMAVMAEAAMTALPAKIAKAVTDGRWRAFSLPSRAAGVDARIIMPSLVHFFADRCRDCVLFLATGRLLRRYAPPTTKTRISDPRKRNRCQCFGNIILPPESIIGCYQWVFQENRLGPDFSCMIKSHEWSVETLRVWNMSFQTSSAQL